MSKNLQKIVCLTTVFLAITGELLAQTRSQTQSGSGQPIVVSGVVSDSSGDPLAGAYVILKGTSQGTTADIDGKYTFKFSSVAEKNKKNVLVFSFIGMLSKEITVSSSTTLNVTLEPDGQLDEVVVNGFYSQPKETFTGAATTISGEEIIAISPTNLVKGIVALTPGMVMVENNAQGSNPNAIPSLLVRGANTLITNESEEGVNNPLIVLDGVEITMEELYDLDMLEIERGDVLKDASETILYGVKGANGVIVIERKRVSEERVKLSYNFVPTYSIPDLSSFNLTNAEQKLELERLAGLYDAADGSMDNAYAYKLEQVRKGVNTNWLKAPLRVSFGHSHNLSLSSRTDALEFRASVSYSDSYGVMKGDNRRRAGINFSINYHLANKLTLAYQTSISYTRSVDSPYGSFSDYVDMNPYNSIYDENGDYIKSYSFNPYSSSSTTDSNPLYDATLSSFDKSSSQSVTNSLSGRWNIPKNLSVTGQASLVIGSSSSQEYESPDMAKYLTVTDITKRGSYTFYNSDRTKASGKFVINYGRSLDTKGSMFRISGGSNVDYSSTKSRGAEGIGFLKDQLSDISFALSYPTTGSPSGSDNLSTGVGFFANANFSLWNRYFVDASYRTSGSSKFGSNNSFAPFWSLGAGWNLHNEKFAKDLKWLNSLVFRISTGYTGSVSFDYYQAKTVYRYSSSYRYYSGIGALPRQMGNPDLKWQRTLNNNVGLTGAFLDNRFHLSFDYYRNTTYDMVMAINLPPSVGTTSMNVNFGELINSGLDLSASGQIIRNNNWFWSVTVTGGHVMDEIRHISDALKGVEVTDAYDSSKPKILFEEGGSQYDIYAMRSAGIDPATGQEIFIKKNGEYTYVYDSDERVAVGNTNPILQGSILTTLRWKRWSLSVSSTYTFGGDYYNTTLQNKVENIDVYHNVDARAFTDRWKEPGDLSRYLSIASTESSHYSERFVERRNEIYISSLQIMYDFVPKAITRIGLRKLAVGIGLSDIGRLSTVKYERGTSYPYCRSFNITFRPTF